MESSSGGRLEKLDKGSPCSEGKFFIEVVSLLFVVVVAAGAVVAVLLFRGGETFSFVVGWPVLAECKGGDEDK